MKRITSFNHYLIGTVVLMNSAWMFMSLFFGNYFEQDFISSLLYPASDCTFQTPPVIGSHCFNDGYWPITVAQSDNPWGVHEGLQLVGSSSMLLVYVPFAMIAKISGDLGLSVALYLGAMAISITFTAWFSARKKSYLEQLVVVLFFGIFSFPTLVALDRGNSLGFTILPLYLFLSFLQQKEFGKASVFLLITSLIKPQFFLVFIIFFFLKKYKILAKATAGFLIVNFLTYLLWFKAWPSSVSESLLATSNHGGNPAVLIEGYSARNISIIRGLYVIADLLIPKQDGTNKFMQFMEQMNGVIPNLLFVLFLFVLIFIQRNRLDPVLLSGIAIIFFSLLPKLTAAYYSLSVLPLALILIKEPQLINLSSSVLKKILTWSIFSVIVVSLTRFILPSFEQDQEYIYQSSDLIPLSVIALIAALIFDSLLPNSSKLQRNF